MASVDVLDWNKKKVGSAELSSEVFEQPVRKDILHTMVKWQLACRRQGTHKAKSRAEVSGSGKKPYKQKGTGNARQGSTQSPLLEGGGVHFAPRPRDYSYELPRKLKQKGLKSALSYLYSEGRLQVVDSMTSTEGKTKEMAARLKGFGTEKTVLVCENSDDNFKRATKNLKNVKYYPVVGMNVFDLLKMDSAVITQDALKSIEKRCGLEG